MKGITASIGLLMTATAVADEPTFIVEKQDVTQHIEIEGRVQAVNQGTLAAQTSGRIVALYVDVNDFVEQGDVVLEISSEQQSASLDAALAQQISAQAQDTDAQAQLRRFRQLFPQGAISKDQLDKAEANAKATRAAVRSAQAAVKQAKESLGYTSITAPYTGVVTQRHIQLGETVAPGTQLLSGMSLTELRVEAALPQRYQPQVDSVDQFTLITPDGAEIAPERLTLFNYADPQAHTFKLRLDLPETETPLYPGMWIKTRFNYGQKQAILVPRSAVVRRGELTAVYRMADQHQILNPVRLGQEYAEHYQVLSGLEIGDEVRTLAFPKAEK